MPGDGAMRISNDVASRFRMLMGAGRLIGAAVVLIAVCGCPADIARMPPRGLTRATSADRDGSPGPDRAERSRARTASVAVKSMSARRVARLVSEVRRLRADLDRAVGTGDLLESVWIRWRHVPAARATLAVCIKTVRVLEREAVLRQRGAGVLSDPESVLAWVDRAIERVGRQAGRIKRDAGAVETGPPIRVGFVDRSALTRRDRWFGDFDLLVCAGFGVVGVDPGLFLASSDPRSLARRAAATGVELVNVPPTGGVSDADVPASGAGGAVIRPVTLGDLIDGIGRGDHCVVVDPAGGESWGAMLARRALMRGVLGRDTTRALGCMPARGQGSDAARLRATLWTQALDGQVLSLIEGWRDPRDGTRTTYASRFGDPAFLESAAHSALDLQRMADVVASFKQHADLAIAVDRAVLDPDDSNRWAPPFARLADALVDAQVHFDLIAPTGPNPTGGAASRYTVVARYVDLIGAGRDGPTSRQLRYRLGGQAKTVEAKSADPGDIAMALRDVVRREADFSGPVARDSDNTPARGVYLAANGDQSLVAVVNLLGAPRRVHIVAGDRDRSARWRDYRTGGAVSGPVSLEPYAVRILQRRR